MRVHHLEIEGELSGFLLPSLASRGEPVLRGSEPGELPDGFHTFARGPSFSPKATK